LSSWFAAQAAKPGSSVPGARQMQNRSGKRVLDPCLRRDDKETDPDPDLVKSQDQHSAHPSGQPERTDRVMGPARFRLTDPEAPSDGPV